MKKIVALALMACMLFALVPTALAGPALEVQFGFDSDGDGFVDVYDSKTITETTASFEYNANTAEWKLPKKQNRYDPKAVEYVPIVIYLPDGYNYNNATVTINDVKASVSKDSEGSHYITASVNDPAANGKATYSFKVDVKGTNYYDWWKFEFVYTPKTAELDMTVTAEENGVVAYNNNNMVSNVNTTQEKYSAHVYNNKLYIDYYGTYYPVDLPLPEVGDYMMFDINFSFFTTGGVALYDAAGRQYLAMQKSWFNTMTEEVLKAKNNVLIPYLDKDNQNITFWVDNGKAYYKRTLPIVYRAVEGQNDPKGVFFGDSVTTVKEGSTFTPAVFYARESSIKYYIVLFDQYGEIQDGDLFVSMGDENKRTTSAGSKVQGNSIVAGDPGVIWARVYTVFHDASKEPTANSRVYWDDMKFTVTGGSAQGTNYYVTTRALNVRKGPGTEYAKTSPYTVYRNDTLSVISIANGWAKVDMNGSVVYVSAKYIAKK